MVIVPPDICVPIYDIADIYRDYRQSRLHQQQQQQNIEFAHRDGVENVYLSEIEYRVCGGASLTTVSRDIARPALARGCCNFSSHQFTGPTAEPRNGNWDALFSRLVDATDIRYGCRVNAMGKLADEQGQQQQRYVVSTENGDRFEADKIVVAVNAVRWPTLATMTTGFDWLEEEEGDLGDGGAVAMDNGADCGTLLIVQMTFGPGDLFWRDRVATDTAFAIVPGNAETRGFCHLFKEARRPDSDLVVLQTRIFGLAATRSSGDKDADIVGAVLAKLACLCAGRPGGVPVPVSYEISRVEGALLACTAVGKNSRRWRVARGYEDDIVTTSKVVVSLLLLWWLMA